MDKRTREPRSERPRSGRRKGERPEPPPPPPPAYPIELSPDRRVLDFLAERYGSTAVPQLEILVGDASTRRYYRVRDTDKSYILCVYPEPFDPATLPFLVLRDLLAGWGLPVPETVAVDGPRGITMQEDLGDLTLQECMRDVSPDQQVELYRQALDQLVVLQRESVRARQRASCFQIAFDFEKLSWEMHFFWKHFLESYRRIDLSVEDRAAVADGFHRLCSEISSWPRVLTHRDFHSRNLMSFRDKLYWIDFQDARMGPATYDLVSLLRDSYVELSEDFVADRVEEFRQRAVPGESRDTFRRRFELMSMQRNLKALGTFGYQGAVRGSRVYLPYIPRTLANARRNLVRYPEFAALHRALARHLEELQ